MGTPPVRMGIYKDTSLFSG